MVTTQTKPPARIFRQAFLGPGRYKVGGRIGIVTQEGLAEVKKNTLRLLANNYRPPLLKKHAIPGAKEGGPVPAETPADAIDQGVGHLVGIGQEADGTLYQEISVSDADIAKKIDEGSIRFTSPEIRPSFEDGHGNKYGPIIAHTALTHWPRNPNQGPMEPVSAGAAQFSLTSETSQFALEDLVGDDDEEGGDQSSGSEDESKGKGAADATDTAANPDLPPDDSRSMQFQACLQLMQELFGVSLQADANEETGWRDLLGCLKTLKAVRDQMKAEEAEKASTADENPDAPNYTTDQPPMGAQFSLDDVEAGRVPNKLASRIIRQEHTSLVSRIEKLASSTSITPALASSLKARAAISQFSLDDGDVSAVPVLTLPDLIGMLENGMPPGKLIGNPTANEAAQFSADSEQPIADGAAPTVKSNGEIDREAARKVYEASRHLIPKGLRRETATA